MSSFSTSLKHPLVSNYLLLIEPRKDIADSIQAIKLQFAEKFKAHETIKGKPFLLLASYTQFSSYEDRIRQKLRSLSISAAPFLIELQNYGSFPSHTLFINVTTKVTFQNLAKSIRTQLQSQLKLNKDNKPHFIIDPYIVIARRLKPWQYEQGWLELSHSNYTGKFIATGITLLKKSTVASQYIPIETFEFKNMPMNVKQATLF